MTIPDLTEDEVDLLCLSMGMAMGVASEFEDRKLVTPMLRLTNKLNANNPHWRPYAVDDEVTNGSHEG
jgi:hypothetical protein